MMLSQALTLPQQSLSLPWGWISRPSQRGEEQRPRHHLPPHISCSPPQPSSSAGSPGHHWRKSREARGKGHDAGSSSRKGCSSPSAGWGVTTRTGCLRTRWLCPGHNCRTPGRGSFSSASKKTQRESDKEKGSETGGVSMASCLPRIAEF